MFQDPATLYYEPAARRCLEICEEIVAEIRTSPLTPTGATGRLREGYKAQLTELQDGAEIVTDVVYWKYVENGTSKMRSQPHVRPAVEFVRWKNT